jgi:hypothetical protein
VRIVWLSSKGAARYLTGTSRPAFRHQNIACEVLAKMGLTITNYSFLASGKYEACPDHAVTDFSQNIILKIIIVYARSRDNDRACLFPTKWPFLSAQERRAPVRFAEENEYTSWFVNYLADDVVPRIIETLPL